MAYHSFGYLSLTVLLLALAGADAICFAMPITELLTAIYGVVNMRRYTKQFPKRTFVKGDFTLKMKSPR